jgi:hypothetical protein
MVSRRTLIPLAVVAVVLLAIALATGNDDHGFWNTVNVITFNGFLLCLLLLIVLGVVVLVRSRRPGAR